MGTCHICPQGDNTVPDDEVVDHLRVLHPDVYGEGPERWPDGDVVVHNLALDPGDFNAEREA